MLALRRGLLFLVAVAGTAMITLPSIPVAPIALAPVTVAAFPSLPAPDSLAALLVSPGMPRREAGGLSRGETEILLDVVAAVDAIPSRSMQVSVLDAIADVGRLDSSVVAAVARAGSRLTSSRDRTRVIRAIIERQPEATRGARRAVLDAIRGVGSAGDRGGLLQLFVTRRGLGEQALVEVLGHVARLPSSGERSRVLVAAARAHRISGRARTAYVNAARGIPSSRDRSRALAALNARSSNEEGW